MLPINIVRNELARPIESEFSLLLALPVARRRNPHAVFRCYKAEGQTDKILPTVLTYRRLTGQEIVSLMDASRYVEAIRTEHAWALDIKICELLATGRALPDFGSPAHVEILCIREITDLGATLHSPFVYQLITKLRITLFL